jgi:hypothetical protein
MHKIGVDAGSPDPLQRFEHAHFGWEFGHDVVCSPASRRRQMAFVIGLKASGG